MPCSYLSLGTAISWATHIFRANPLSAVKMLLTLESQVYSCARIQGYSSKSIKSRRFLDQHMWLRASLFVRHEFFRNKFVPCLKFIIINKNTHVKLFGPWSKMWRFIFISRDQLIFRTFCYDEADAVNVVHAASLAPPEPGQLTTRICQLEEFNSNRLEQGLERENSNSTFDDREQVFFPRFICWQVYQQSISWSVEKDTHRLYDGSSERKYRVGMRCYISITWI